MTSLPARHMAECRETQAVDDLSTWHFRADARAIMVKIALLDQFIDSGIGHGIDVTSLEDQAVELEQRLDDIRDAALDRAFRRQNTDSNSMIDWLEDIAPTVTKAMEEFRRERIVQVSLDIAPDNGNARVAA